jgi:hypothetical protein
VPESAQQTTGTGEPPASAKERRPEPSATTGIVEPVVAHIEEEAPAEAGLVDIASILGTPTVTVVRSNLLVKCIPEWSLPSSVWRRYEPGPVTFAIEKGPSHGELSLCSPSVFWMRRKTRTPTLKERSLML